MGNGLISPRPAQRGSLFSPSGRHIPPPAGCRYFFTCRQAAANALYTLYIYYTPCITMAIARYCNVLRKMQSLTYPCAAGSTLSSGYDSPPTRSGTVPLCFFGPNGAGECSRGWSGAAAKPPVAEPVEPKFFFSSRPSGAKEIQRSEHSPTRLALWVTTASSAPMGRNT